MTKTRLTLTPNRITLTQSSHKTSRFVAIETLCKLDKTSLPVSLLFTKAASAHALQGSERHLAMNLIYGVLRQRQYLDSLLERLCRQPLKKLQPFVHQALAVGLYQIFFLDRIPDSAAVNETVKALKAARTPKRLHGFVNGVLRESIRQQDTLPSPEEPDRKGNLVLNHPQWLTGRWLKRYGRKEMERICTSNNTQPPLVIRINTLATDRDAYLKQLNKKERGRPGSYAPDAAVLSEYHGAITQLPGYDQGFFQVQDEAAQLVSLLLAPFTLNGSYLDGCAGLGGKTSHLLQITDSFNTTITAVEPEKRREQKFQENLTRLHPQKNVTFFSGNLQDFSHHCTTKFDGILIDAPCSGTGVIGRHPDIRWNRKETDLAGYQKTQLELLEIASKLTKPGGVLVYATCSMENEENEDVIDSFLKAHDSFSLTDCTPFLPEAARSHVSEKYFRPQPADSIDGFFAARLVLKKCDA